MADPTPVEQILNLCRPGEKEHEQRIIRYDRAYRTYRALPDPRAAEIPDWRSRVRVPYAQGTIDTALVNIVTGSPRCLVLPRHPDDVQNAKALQNLLDYFVAEDHLSEKQALFAQQGLIFGVTVAKNHWLYTESPKTSWETVQGMNGMPVRRQTTSTVVTRDGPCFQPWDVYNVWWDPNARDVDSARYVVLREYRTKAELLEQRYDTDTGIGLYDNLDELFATGDTAQRQATSQESYLGSTDNKRKGTFEILEVWTDRTLTVIGNRRVILRQIANPYWHGKKPIVIAQTRPDLFEMQGIPETDLVADIQAAAQTLQNMTIDSLHMTVMVGATYREGSVVDPNMLALRPNFRWAVQDHGDVQPFQMPQLDRNVFEERTRLLGDMERVTGITAYLSGADSATVNQTTATGVAALQGAANTLLRFKAAQIHDKGYQRTFEQWGEMIQQFLDHDVWVEITGPEGEKAWQSITPQDVVGSFHYRLEGSEEAITRQQERNEAIGLLNALAPYVQMGKVNPDPIIQRVALSFDVADPESLTVAQQPQLPPAAPSFGGANGTATPLMNGAALPLPVQQAITG